MRARSGLIVFVLRTVDRGRGIGTSQVGGKIQTTSKYCPPYACQCPAVMAQLGARGASLYQTEVLTPLPTAARANCCRVSRSSSVCVAAGNAAYLQHCDGPLTAFEFDSTVDTVSWSEDGSLLVLGDSDGVLHFVCPGFDAEHILFSQVIPLPKCDDGGKAFKGISFVHSAVEGVYDLLVLGSSGIVFVLQNFEFEQFKRALLQGDRPSVQQVQSEVKLMLLDLSCYHGSSCACLVPFKSSSPPAFASAGSGKTTLCVWEKSSDGTYSVTDSISHLLRDIEITGCEITNEDDFLVTLDSSGAVALWQLSSLVMVSAASFGQSTAMEIAIAEGVAALDKGGSHTCPHTLCVLAEDHHGQRTIEMMSLPDFGVICSLPVSPAALLCRGVVAEDSLIFVDVDEEEDGKVSLQIKRVVQTLPENRLKALLKQQKFEEAEIFAQKFNLDPELVHKYKSVVLNDLLCAVTSTEEQVSLTMSLFQTLELIKDCCFVVHLALSSCYPSLSTTLEMLQFARKKLLSALDDEATRAAKVKVFSALNKLTTFQLVHGDKSFSPHSWQAFLEASVLDELTMLLQSGDLQRAAWLWGRHQSDLLSQLGPNNLPTLINAMPESIPSSQLTRWITTAVLPFTLEHFAGLAADLFHWIERRVRALELMEKELWPQNGLEMVATVVDAVHSFQSSSAHMSLQVNAIAPLDYPSNGQSPLSDLISLQRKLNDIHYLLSSLQCPISLSDYEKESCEMVVSRLLDKVVAAELVAATVKTRVLPYVEKHGQKLDHVLVTYIKHFLAHAPRHSLGLSGSPWEAKAIAILQTVKDKELYVGGCVAVLKHVQTPWSDAVEALVQECLRLDHPSVALLQKQYNLLQLKKMLHSYGVRDFNFSDASKGLLYIRRILAQDGADVLKDALQVAEMYQLPAADVYMHHIINLGKKNKLGPTVEAMRELPQEVRLCALGKAFSYARTRLQFCYSVDQEEPAGYVGALRVAILSLKELQGPLKEGLECNICEDWSTVDDKIELLERLLSLWSEYSLLYTPQELSSKTKCQLLFAEKVEEFVDLQKASAAISTSLTSKNYHKIVRFCQLLGYSEEGLMEAAVSVYLQRKEAEKAAELCRFLLKYSAHPGSTAGLLARVVGEMWASVRDDPGSVGRKDVLSMRELSAAVVCAQNPGGLPDALEQYQICSLVYAVHAQTEDSDDSTSYILNGFDKPVFEDWNWSPRFIDDGLVLKSSSSMVLAMRYALSRLPQHSGGSNGLSSTLRFRQVALDPLAEVQEMVGAAYKLNQLLLDNGHSQLAVRCAVQTHVVCSMNRAMSESGRTASGAAAMLKEGEGLVESLLDSLSSKVLSSRRMDHDYALGLLLLVPPQQAVGKLQSLRARSTSSYSRVIALCKLAIDYGRLANQPAVVEQSSGVLMSAQWGKKLSKYKISFTEAFRGGAPEKTRVISELMRNRELSLELLIEYCSDFNLGIHSTLWSYLRVLLSEWEEGYQDRVTGVLQHIGHSPSLAEKLANFLMYKITPYDYEKIAFVLQLLSGIEKASQALPDQGLLLLDCLRLYTREEGPSEYERQWFVEHYCVSVKEEEPLDYSDVALPALSSKHLPFHPLLYGNSMDIIKVELSKSTVGKLAPIANILRLSSDNFYSFAIKSIITHQQTAGSAPASSASVGFEDVAPYLARISDFNRALAVAKWLSKELKNVAAKIECMKSTFEIVKQWREQASSEDEQQEAAEKMTMFQSLLRITQTELLLRDHGIDEAEYLDLSSRGALLIMKLFTDFPVRKETIPPVHLIASEVALINNINLEKITRKLVEEWLPSSGSVKDMDITQMSMLEDPTELCDEETEDQRNMKRLIYLLTTPANLEAHAQLLLNWAKRTSSTASSSSRVRALQILFAIAPSHLIEAISGAPISNIRDFMQQALFVSKLEGLHMSTSLSAFQSCSKEGLVKSLWRNHSQEPKALYLICEVSLYYQIFDPVLWGKILEQLLALGMLPYLRHVLRSLVSKPAFWSITALPAVWQKVLLTPFQDASAVPLMERQRNECLESLRMLHGCPFPFELDVGALVKAFCCVELRAHALSAALLVPSPSEQHKAIESVLSGLKQEEVLELLDELTEKDKGGQFTGVLQVVYTYLNSTSQHQLLLGSHHFPAYVHFLISRKMLDSLLIATLHVNRTKEAIQLVEMYNDHHQSSQLKGVQALKEYVQSHSLEGLGNCAE